LLRNAVLSLLFTVTLFLSAALLFVVQPLVAWLVLPLLGGTPAVWNTCMVFFQAVLLAGYGYAHAATSWLGTRRQPLLHLLLLPLPFLLLPIALPANLTPSETAPVFWLLGLLLVVAGLPFFVVSTGAPLLQRWFAETGHPAARDPYFLYAASNLGSILALLAYPAVVEPLLPLAGQARMWTAGYAALAVLVVACAVALWRSPPAPETGAAPADTAPAPTAARRLRWVLLALVPSSLMLSVTTYITTDVAAIPLLWVLPLALYLLSFVVTFARRPWLPHRFVVRWTPLVVLVVVFLLLSEAGESVLLSVWLLVGLHCLGLFWVALLCHGELARTRPDRRHLTEFYFWLSVGGVLGGAFNALAAPLLFNGVVEYPLALVLACALRPAPAPAGTRADVRPFWRDLPPALGVGALTAALVLTFRAAALDLGRLETAAVFTVPLLAVYVLQDRPLRHALALGALLLASCLYPGVYGRTEYRARSFFGVHRVTVDPSGRFRVLVHGNTVHGKQSLDPARRREPLAYYHRTGPAGVVFTALDGDERLRRVGVVGMGAATLCAYAEPGQRWTFYEIDPAVVRIATDDRLGLFTFWHDCAARCGAAPDVVLGDARLTLARSDEKFGLLIVDAFSSEAIPVHLLTREALAVYRARLDEGGILLFHISNNYLDLEPVLAALARDADPPMACLSMEDRVVPREDKEEGKLASHWVALAADPEALAEIRYKGRWVPAVGRTGVTAWRDDYSDLFGVLRWREEE
jgi:hypothetical protein